MTKAVERRAVGRPQVRSDEETSRIIAKAAFRVFIANGYSSASMDEVARIAGISKKTLYRLFPDKETLFRAAVLSHISAFVLSVDEAQLATQKPDVALASFMTEYGRLTLSTDTVALQKLVLAESERFPEIAADFYRDAVGTPHSLLVACLKRYCSAGVLELSDPDEAAGMLRGMMVFEPLRGAMLGLVPLPGIRGIKQRAVRCVNLFLKGCWPQGRTS